MRNPLHGLTPMAQMFVRCIVAGDSPEQAVRMAFPLKQRNLDVWAAKLLSREKVIHAIDVLTKGKVNPHARRIELIKLVESKDVSSATKLGAIKELARMDASGEEELTKKKAAHDDEDLQKKLHVLGQKAAS